MLSYRECWHVSIAVIPALCSHCCFQDFYSLLTAESLRRNLLPGCFVCAVVHNIYVTDFICLCFPCRSPKVSPDTAGNFLPFMLLFFPAPSCNIIQIPDPISWFLTGLLGSRWSTEVRQDQLCFLDLFFLPSKLNFELTVLSDFADSHLDVQAEVFWNLYFYAKPSHLV